MSDRTLLQASLSILLGDDALVAPGDCERYERSYRQHRGRAAAVVRPRDVEGVRALVRFCRLGDHRLVIQGAHSGLVGAATPDESAQQIVVSLDRLRQVEIDPQARIATCGAGALLSSVNAAAAEYGLVLPIDLGADPSIGGMVATNTGGARLLRYGGMRERVIGLEAVIADEDATVIGDLGGLRKNNVGLDLKRLLVGSGGKLAIVTAVQVDLQPVIRQDATAIAIPSTLDRIPRIVTQLEDRLGPFLTACEGMSRNAMRAALDTHPAIRRPFDELPDYALLIEAGTSFPLDTGIDVAALLEEALMACLDGDDPLLGDVILGRGRDFWAMRHAISDGLKASGRVVALDISVQRARLPALRIALAAAVDRYHPGLVVCDFGHVGDGAMHFNIVCPHGRAIDEDEIATLRRTLFDVVVEGFGGSFSAEHGIGPANMAQYRTYRSATERDIIDRIARITDPQGVFS